MHERIVRFGNSTSPVPPREFIVRTQPQRHRRRKPSHSQEAHARHFERRGRSGFLRGQELYQPHRKDKNKIHASTRNSTPRTVEQKTPPKKKRIHPHSPKLAYELSPAEKEFNANLLKIYKDHPKRIRCVEDAERIANALERNFAKFLISHNPDLIIVPQPYKFSTDQPGLIKRVTKPDFFVHNPNSDTPEVPIFIEITKTKLGKFDPKARQRRVMKLAAPGVRYVSLYGQNFENIHARHGEFILPPNPASRVKV